MKLKLFFILILFSFRLFGEDFSASFQEKLLLPVAEFRSSQSLSGDDFMKNWGAVIFTPKKIRNFPCQFKIGNLSPGGGVSKLNNPSLNSTITPFSMAKTDVSTITAALPGISLYSKPVTYFAEIGYQNRKKLFSQSKVNCFYNPENYYPVFSVSQTLLPWKNIVVTGALTAGEFTYDENTFNSWFTTSDFYYHQGKHFCMNPQVAVELPHFKTLFSAATYESPFGEIISTWKSENKISAGRFTYNLSVFCNQEENLLSANESLIKNVLQIKTGIQANYPVGKKRPVFLKTGINAYSAIRLDEKNFDEHKFKIAAGTKITSLLYNFNISGNANFTCDTSKKTFKSDFDSGAFLFSNNWYLRKISPGITTSFSFSPENNYQSWTTSEKLALSAVFAKSPRLTANTAFSFTQKDGVSIKQSISTSLTSSWRLKYLSLTGKLQLSFSPLSKNA